MYTGRSSPPALLTRRLLCAIGLLVGIGPASIDLYLPALPTITEALDATAPEIQASLQVFFAGMAIVMLLAGPISDRYGRRVLLIGGTVVFIFSSLALARAESADELIYWRFVQACGVGVATILGRAIIRDVARPDQRVRALSIVGMVMGVVPVLSPLAGALLLELFHWRALFLALAIFGVVILVIALLLVPETLRENSGEASLARAFISYGRMFRAGRVMLIILAADATFGLLFAYISESSFVFINYFGFTPLFYGGFFAVNALGIMFGLFLNTRLIGRLGSRKLALLASASSMLGGLGLLVAWMSGGGLWVMAPLIFCCVWIMGVMQTNGLARLMILYPRNAASASALLTAGGFAMGFASNELVQTLHDGTPFALCFTLALMGSLSFVALLVEYLRYAPEDHAL